MKTPNHFKKGQILVNTKKQVYSCGKTKLGYNALVKAADDGWNSWINVYRDFRSEKKEDSFSVNVEPLRLATEEECKLYEKGERYA